MPGINIFDHCTWERHGDFLLLRNEFSRVIGMLQIFSDAQIEEERCKEQEAALAGHILKTGRL